MKEIQLTRGYVALVDDEDYDLVSSRKWQATPQGRGKSIKWRAVAKINYSSAYMHRIIMGAKKNEEVDHINGDTLDNRRSNLRICTHAENNRNTIGKSRKPYGFKGISWREDRKRWRAAIMHNRKSFHLGNFIRPDDAARAYDDAAKRLFGKFAKLNFPEL